MIANIVEFDGETDERISIESSNDRSCTKPSLKPVHQNLSLALS
jgi:hypothetical protein